MLSKAKQKNIKRQVEDHVSKNNTILVSELVDWLWKDDPSKTTQKDVVSFLETMLHTGEIPHHYSLNDSKTIVSHTVIDADFQDLTQQPKAEEEEIETQLDIHIHVDPESLCYHVDAHQRICLSQEILALLEAKIGDRLHLFPERYRLTICTHSLPFGVVSFPHLVDDNGGIQIHRSLLSEALILGEFIIQYSPREEAIYIYPLEIIEKH